MRKIFRIDKVGHAGTLDPEAEGLLVLAFGRATKLLQYLDLEPKTYEFSVQFGTQTDTLDREGVMTACNGKLPDADSVAAIIPSFTGPQMQTPPEFSAIKIKGERAYDLARKGKTPKLLPRSITIHQITLKRYDSIAGTAFCTVVCSGGTYVRAIARDMACRLDTFGYASSIRRVSCGNFSCADALGMELISDSTALLPVGKMLRNIPQVNTDDRIMRQRVACGRDIELQEPINGERALLFSQGNLIAMLKRKTGLYYHPEIVFCDNPEATYADS